MATNKSDTEINKGLLICKHCDKSIQDPRSLPCFHAFCTKCLQTLAKRKKPFKCPQCGKMTRVPRGGVTTFPIASHITALAEYVQLFNKNNPSVPCYNKEKDDEHQDATVKCMECDAYYCQTCNASHKLSKIARDHRPIKLTDLTKERFLKAAKKKVSPCESHRDTPVKYLCQEKTCNVFICERCTEEKHNGHECRLLEDIANEYRQNMNRILEEEMAQMQTLLARLAEVKAEIQKTDQNHENNVNVIKERTRQMHRMLEEQERQLLEEEQRKIDAFRSKCAEAKQRADKAMANTQSKTFTDREFAQEIREISEGIETPITDVKFPEVWNEPISLTPQGPPLLERRQGIRKSVPMKCHNVLNVAIDSLAVFEKMTVALHCSEVDGPSVVNAMALDGAKVKAVTDMIGKLCPNAYQVVRMVKDGQEKMVIVSNNGDVKILSLDGEKIENLEIDASPKLYAIAVDEHCNIFYTSHEKPLAIRKKMNSKTETIFINQDGNKVLNDPWYLATNINGDIIVSDAMKKSVFIFNEKGELMNSYGDFPSGDKCPNGVCTDDDGNIYISDTNGHCIHRLDKKGKFKDIPVTKEDSLWQPTALQWYNGMLVVGQSNGQIKYFQIN